MSEEIEPQLQPEPTERIEFVFGDLFPADDPVAAWLVNLSRAVDDLLLANRWLEGNLALASDQDGPQPRNHEVIYDIKAVASHAWELAKFIQLKSSEDPAIAGFIEKRMPREAKEDLAGALMVLEPAADDPPGERPFTAILASARDQASHYSNIDSKLIERALRSLATDFEGKPNETSAMFGDNFKDFYAPFATEMDWQLFHPVGDNDMEPFKKFNSRLNALVGRLIRFSVTAVHVHFSFHEADTTAVALD